MTPEAGALGAGAGGAELGSAELGSAGVGSAELADTAAVDAAAVDAAVRWAGVDDAAAAVEVLREAARRAAELGPALWDPEGFTVEEHRALAGAGELLGGFDGGRLVACVRLQRADPLLWPEHPPGYARYVHKLAVRRSHAGAGWGVRLVRRALDEARRAGASAVCLDTLPEGRLPAFYAALGFRRHDDALWAVGRVRVIRMWRPVEP